MLIICFDDVLRFVFYHDTSSSNTEMKKKEEKKRKYLTQRVLKHLDFFFYIITITIEIIASHRTKNNSPFVNKSFDRSHFIHIIIVIKWVNYY